MQRLYIPREAADHRCPPLNRRAVSAQRWRLAATKPILVNREHVGTKTARQVLLHSKVIHCQHPGATRAPPLILSALRSTKSRMAAMLEDGINTDTTMNALNHFGDQRAYREDGQTGPALFGGNGEGIGHHQLAD